MSKYDIAERAVLHDIISLAQQCITSNCCTRHQLLDIAVTYGAVRIIRYLITSNINLEAFNENGCAPLHMAAGQGKLEAVKVLVSEGKADIDALTALGENALFIAIEKGQLHVAKYLITDTIIEIDVCNDSGNTPLHLIISCNQLVKVSPLDEPINIINYHRQRLDIIELLLEYTKRDDAVNIPNNDGNTPFHLAIIHDELDIVQYLFEDTNEGPDITLFNNDGNNALHLGVIHNRVNIVKYLVKYAKASIAEVNLNNHNAISLAEEDGNDELVEYLTSAYTKQSILNSYNTYHLRNFFGSDFSDFSEDLSESGTLDYSD